MNPLCFILMPFGTKPDPTGGKDIDFDRVYETGIKPAIENAGMEPIRADEEKTGGIIHGPMFERLLLCNFAVADLTTANANVFYELGVRHTARPATTVTIFATHQPIPFDINFLRSLPYDLGKNNSFSQAMAKKLRTSLTERLMELRNLAATSEPVDSPLFQLIREWQPGQIARLKTDTFRKQVEYNKDIKLQLDEVRETAKNKETSVEAQQLLTTIRDNMGSLDGAECGTVIDLMLTYRALSDWKGMIEVQQDMPKPLAEQVLVQEQLGFALNRSSGENPENRGKALVVLKAVEERQGPSSETCGLIGRIHKDYWTEAVRDGNDIEALGHLNNAIDAYIRGFMADQRDAYPGINAITLLDIKGDLDSIETKGTLLPVVRFAVQRRVEGATADYWDHATMLELAVLENKKEDAASCLGQSLAEVRESWEPMTTENNLKLIADARSKHGKETDWLNQIIEALQKKRATMA
ncbi:MAG: TRAFs-binding domain-containing protein [Desulfuromusa sp.]|nr:TRAFs-binding domain-containing protein [Desulfuromusa sp.]